LAKWKVVFSKRAIKDWELIRQSEHKEKVITLLNIIEEDPLTQPPPVKQLQGNMKGAYSRRINHQYRLVYRLDVAQKTVNVVMMWLHY